MATRPRRTVIVTLSERCNLNCVYCYESGKNLSLMPLEMAKGIIRREFAQSNGYDELFFEFHGGEIALFFDRLREVLEWLWSAGFDKPFRCFSITNGTLIHGEIADWFERNRERITLGISLDGTPEVHNRNRCNSYGLVDFGYFLRNWPKQPVKMTFSAETVPHLADCLRHAHSLGFEVRANLAYGVPWPESLLPEYAGQLTEMVAWYLENPEVPPASLFTSRLERIGQMAVGGRHAMKWCSCGDNGVCYAPDGKLYPCQVFMPSSLGYDASAELSALDYKDVASFHDPACGDCPLEPSCATCPAHCYKATRTLNIRPRDLCAYRKVEILHAATLMGKMLQKPERYRAIRDLPQEDIPFVARGVLEVMAFFKHRASNF